MTITRLGHLIGELRYPAEYIEFGTLAGISYSNTKARTGSWSYRFGASEEVPIGIAIPIQTYIRAGMWINHNGLVSGSAQARIFTWHTTGGAGSSSGVRWSESTDLLELVINGVVQDSVAVATVGFNNPDTWMHCGLVVKADTSSGFASFYLNGSQILTFSGNTGADIAGVYAMGTLSINNEWANFAYMDDFYIDSLTVEADTPPPAKRFLFSVVDGAGADAEFTPLSGSNYENVDDIPPDDDTSYNRALSVGLKDTLNTASISVPTDYVIRAAIPMAIARKTDSGVSSQLKLHSFDGATYQSSAAKNLAVTYGILFERQTAQPDETAWNQTDFNAMQFGYESAGSFS